MNLDQMSRDELAGELRRLIEASDGKDREREKIIHDLRVHQVELELQNRELREAHAALEAAKARFEELYDFAPIAYFTFDPHGLVLEANLTAATLVGRARAWLIGQPFPALVGMTDSAPFREHLRRCARERRPALAELRFTVGRDETRDVQAVSVPVLDPHGRVVAIRTSFSDITQLKRIEAELERSRREEQTLRTQFEWLDRTSLELAQLLARVDGRGTMILEVLHMIVEHARSIAGGTYAAIGIEGGPDRPFDPWVFSGMDPDTVAAIGRTPRARGLLGEVMRTGHPLRLADLRDHPAFVGFPPHHPPMGSFLGVPVRFGGRIIGHLFVTDKRGAAEFTADDQRAVELFAERAGVAMELARLARQVHASVRDRDNLLAVVSHDLRGPVSTIQLTAELLARTGGAHPELRRPLEMILRSSAQMKQLIDDLLQAATIEAGRFAVLAEPHEVAPIVVPALELLEARAAERSIRLERELADALPAINADERRIVQVLSNLIDNAIKFTREGGLVRLCVTADAGEVRFAVSDDGPGIPSDELPHLFERYWKGESMSERGTGLGLYIAKGIVEAHGGRIWVTSQPGLGSTFTFAIPIAHREDRHAPAP
jgi:PAS domain S-box-containing protein